jgi:hypothetical protein
MSQQARRAANRIEHNRQQKNGVNSRSNEKDFGKEELSETEVMLTAAIEVELAVLRLR